MALAASALLEPHFPRNSAALDAIRRPSISLVVGNQKPTIETVLAYVRPLTLKFIAQFARDLPEEQREEIEQSVNLKVIHAYKGLDPDAGWKSYAWNLARGAVLDYKKHGQGFQESRWSIAKEEAHGSLHTTKIRERVFHGPPGLEDMPDLESVLGRSGVFSETEIDSINIRWELVARLASRDEELHAFAKWIRGHDFEEMAPHFGLSRARIGQLIQAFIDRLDTPSEMDKPWNRQIAFSLGIARHFGIQDCDQARLYRFPIGNDLGPVDLDDLTPKDSGPEYQTDFFGLGTQDAKGG